MDTNLTWLGHIALDNHAMQHLRIKKHWYWFLHDTGIAISMVTVALLFFALAISNSTSLFLGLAAFLALIGLPTMFLGIYQFDNSQYECTESDFISHRKTLMTLDDITLHYYLIREVNIHQTPLGSILGFAEVEIEAGGEDKIILPYVVNHQAIKEYLIPRIGSKSATQKRSVVTDEQGKLKELNIIYN